MIQLTSLIRALTEVLEQERLLLSEIDREIYTEPGTGAFRSSIGAHIRHNLDHFTSFFAGLDSDAIDYEKRRRDCGIAASAEHAIADIEKHMSALAKLYNEQDRSVCVREECDYQSDESIAWLKSSIGRELQFLLGHTVHHHAIIALLLAQKGLNLPEEFGVAPSTQRHEKRSAPQERMNQS